MQPEKSLGYPAEGDFTACNALSSGTGTKLFLLKLCNLRYSKAMTIMVCLLAAATLLELCTYGLPFVWAARKVLVPILIVVVAFTSGALFMNRPNVASGLIALLSLYRAFNGIRVMQQRMHEKYLRRSTRRTSFTLVAAQVLLGSLWFVWNYYNLATHPLWTIGGAVQLIVAIVLLASTARSLNRTLPRPVKKAYTDASLPSITVAIPARNETDDLQECLNTLIASDYPKLEIIVLDDCSQLKRTPEIIRSFAHDGVRFVQGAEPSETWLPKNQAYQRLAQEASGEYIVFCGVDIRFEADTLRKLITALLVRRKSMISVLPQAVRARGNSFAIVQAMRYWWELVPPRRLFRRPPVMSSCWVISKRSLKKAGGFEAVTRSIVPEAYFAHHLIGQDEYSFLRSDALLGVTTVKTSAEQRATAVRMRYPQLHRRPEQVLATVLLETIFLLAPFVLAIGGFWWHIGLATHIFAAIAAGLLVISYVLMTDATNVNSAWWSLVGFPIMIVNDLGLLHYSMWRYEFSDVEWKGRNVCIPTMHVVPHLPKIE